MTASSTVNQPAYENPLMPNAKLRQMYSAMLRLRMFAGRLGQEQKRSSAGFVSGLEACLVGPTIDLGPEDLVCDALQGGAIDFLRGTPAELILNPDRRLRSAGTLADGGAATRLTVPAGTPELLWAAVGAAATLKAQTSRSGVADGAVLVCYARPDDVPPAVWSKLLAHVFTQRLPILFVVLPQRKPQGSRTGQMSTIALRSRVPGIPVDQHDAVAIYRVAQEAIGHARAGAGGALIECVRFVLEGQKPLASDAISGLGEYMLHRQVADQRWMETEAKSFARRIGFEVVHPTR